MEKYQNQNKNLNLGKNIASQTSTNKFYNIKKEHIKARRKRPIVQ